MERGNTRVVWSNEKFRDGNPVRYRTQDKNNVKPGYRFWTTDPPQSPLVVGSKATHTFLYIPFLREVHCPRIRIAKGEIQDFKFAQQSGHRQDGLICYHERCGCPNCLTALETHEDIVQKIQQVKRRLKCLQVTSCV